MTDIVEIATDEAAEKAYAAAAQAVLAKPEAAQAVLVKPEAAPIPFPAKAKRKVAPAKASTPTKPAAKTSKTAGLAAAKSIPHQTPKVTNMTTKKNEQIANNVKKFAADAQGKAKVALAKANVALAEVNALTKANAEALAVSGKVLVNGAKALGAGYKAEGKSAVATVKADAKKLAAVKSPADLLVLQSDLFKRNVEGALTFGAKNSAALYKLASEVFAPVAKRTGEVASKFAKAA